MGKFGLNGSIPWLTNTDGELCLFCKNSVEDVSHFLSDCSSFRDNFESLWSNLSQRIIACNPSDGTQISHFISSLNRQTTKNYITIRDLSFFCVCVEGEVNFEGGAQKKIRFDEGGIKFGRNIVTGERN